MTYTTIPLIAVNKNMMNVINFMVGSATTYGPGRSWSAG